MPSGRTTVSPLDLATMLGIGAAQSYVGNEDWIDPQQVTTRAQQEKAIAAQGVPSIGDLLNTPDNSDAFTNAFVDHYTANAPQAV